MPKQAQVLPSMRIDIPDYIQQTAGLSLGGQRTEVERFILDNYPAVVDGFRVEIANQVTAPRLLTIYNAVAFDRDGNLVNNEEDFSASRSVTLPANGTFYLEAELVTNPSDPDARGFWDPTYVNGGSLPKGREFTENVSTRLTPDWHIVSPVSTTGFAVTTNPNSTKIPIAQILVSGSVISGVTTTAYRSVLRKTVLVSDASAAFFDTRGWPDTFTLIFDPGGFNEETVNVTANDRENGILTLSSAPSSQHDAGERGITGGLAPAQFVAPGDPADKRPRLFQADMEMGHLRNLNPQSNTAGGTADFERSDQNVINLRAYVDFLAAQLRELKFGHAKQIGTGGTPPPWENFDTRHAYFDAAGGVLGARTNTVSIGTGTNSWGDYNVTQYLEENGFATSFTDVLGTAIAHLNFDITPGAGGVIFVKRGTYTMDFTAFNSATDSNLTIVGEGRNETIIQIIGAFPGLDFDGGGTLTLKDLSILRSSGSAAYALNMTSGKLIAENCDIGGVSGTISGGSIRNCNLKNTQSPLTADLSNMVFENVTVTCTSTNAAHTAWNSSTVSSCLFRTTTFNKTGTDNNVMCPLGDINDTTFQRCSFASGGTDKKCLTVSSTITNTSFDDCDFLGSDACLDLTGVFRLKINGCLFSWHNNNKTGVKIGAAAEDVWFRRNYCVQQGSYTGGQISGALSATNPVRLHITENDFFDNDQAITLTGTDYVTIRNNAFRSNSVPGRFAIKFNTGTINQTIIEGNKFGNYQADAADVRVIYLANTSGLSSIRGLKITGNTFLNIGGTGGSRVNTRCVDLSNTDNGSLGYGVIVSENYFYDVQGETTCYGITGTWLANAQARGNHFVFFASTAAALTGWGCIRITDTDGIVIDGNVLDGVGNTSITSVLEAAIHVTRTETNPGSTHNSVVISNNALRFIRPNYIFGAGIKITDVGSHLTVTGNTVSLSTAGLGIGINDTDTGANNPQIYNTTISGNTINGNNNTVFGIYCVWTRETAFVGGRCAIANNTVADCVDGIVVTGPNARARGLSVTGNVIYSSIAAGGLLISDVESFTITGNTINLTNTGINSGMVFTSCRHGTICGNTVMNDTNNASAVAINASHASNSLISITGNSIRFGIGSGPVDGHGIKLPDDITDDLTTGTVVYCVGNVITKITAAAAGTGRCMYRSTEPNGRAWKQTVAYYASDSGSGGDSPDNTPGDPTAFDEIGLNFRIGT